MKHLKAIDGVAPLNLHNSTQRISIIITYQPHWDSQCTTTTPKKLTTSSQELDRAHSNIQDTGTPHHEATRTSRLSAARAPSAQRPKFKGKTKDP